MAFIFDTDGARINPAERLDGVSAANESGKGSPVGTTSSIVLAANDDRRAATFVNDSDTVIYLALGPSASLNSGIRLNPAGGSFEINYNNRYSGAISAICSANNKNLCITEI